MSYEHNKKQVKPRGKSRNRMLIKERVLAPGIEGMAKVTPIVKANACDRLCCNPDGLCYRIGCGRQATTVYVEHANRWKRPVRSDWCDEHAEEYRVPKGATRVEVRL